MTSVPSVGNIYKDLDLIAEKRTRGELVDPLDEQRLRDHQLRRLRRLWLKDQLLTAREPLPRPEKKGLWATYKRYRAKEEKFWDRHLSFRFFKEAIIHGKGFKEWPLLLVYKFQSNLRYFVALAVLPVLPLLYYGKYGDFRVPKLTYRSPTPVYPGDKRFEVPYGEYKKDSKTGLWKKSEAED